jgi:hypothetical protein
MMSAPCQPCFVCCLVGARIALLRHSIPARKDLILKPNLLERGAIREVSRFQRARAAVLSGCGNPHARCCLLPWLAAGRTTAFGTAAVVRRDGSPVAGCSLRRLPDVRRPARHTDRGDRAQRDRHLPPLAGGERLAHRLTHPRAGHRRRAGVDQFRRRDLDVSARSGRSAPDHRAGQPVPALGRSGCPGFHAGFPGQRAGELSLQQRAPRPSTTVRPCPAPGTGSSTSRPSPGKD